MINYEIGDYIYIPEQGDHQIRKFNYDNEEEYCEVISCMIPDWDEDTQDYDGEPVYYGEPFYISKELYIKSVEYESPKTIDTVKILCDCLKIKYKK